MAINKRLIRTNDEAAGDASFNTVVYSGNSGTQPITGVGFQPDLVWVKDRSTAGRSHILVDTVRGATNQLSSDTTTNELVRTSVTSFNSDGFSVGNYVNVNESGNNYVAWCWKAGGAAVTNTDGTITSQVSANTEAGFSIVSYTGNGTTTGQSFGHGLGVVPNMIIIKNRTTAGTSWNVLFPEFMTSGQYMALNQTKGITNSANSGWGGSLPDSSKVFVGGSSWTNTNGNAHIAYCFAEVAGFSKFGSYTGNGLPLGPTIDCGFEPAFVMVKRTNAADNWVIVDNKRGTSNSLFPDSSSQELSNFGAATFSSTGFTVNGASGGWNNSSSTYIYMAFANQF